MECHDRELHIPVSLRKQLCFLKQFFIYISVLSMLNLGWQIKWTDMRAWQSNFSRREVIFPDHEDPEHKPADEIITLKLT